MIVIIGLVILTAAVIGVTADSLGPETAKINLDIRKILGVSAVVWGAEGGTSRWPAITCRSM